MATRNMDNCRRAVTTQDELGAAVDQTVAIQDQILERMKQILDRMNNSESFQDLINDLLEVKKGASAVGEGIKKALKPKDIFEGDDDDIFDK